MDKWTGNMKIKDTKKMLDAIEGVKRYKCKYCKRTTIQDLDELAKHPEKVYKNERRKGWSAYIIGNEKEYICPRCRDEIVIDPVFNLVSRVKNR